MGLLDAQMAESKESIGLALFCAMPRYMLCKRYWTARSMVSNIAERILIGIEHYCGVSP